jgi:type I restriction enzyme R subunit
MTMWGNINWQDEDQVKKHIAGIPATVSQDTAYQNAMKNSDKQNARYRKRACFEVELL